MKLHACLVSVGLLLCGAVDCAAQSTPSYGGAWTVTLENDVFTSSDNNYTNGIGVSWVSNALDTYDERSIVRRWGEFWSFLPFVGKTAPTPMCPGRWPRRCTRRTTSPTRTRRWTTSPTPACCISTACSMPRRDRWAHAWQLRLGVVGPASQADSTQKWFHERIGADEPMGWHTQLPNEPVINVGYTGTYLLAQGDLPGSASWRVIPMVNAGLGNYFTGAGLGLYGEVGWNLVDAIGGTALRQGFNAASTVGVGPVKGWSVSLSGGVAGYGVAHYLPLDGTVFSDSRSVDTKPFIGMATLGISVRHSSFVFFLGRTYFTKTFDTERKSPEFGTLSFSWFY